MSEIIRQLFADNLLFNNTKIVFAQKTFKKLQIYYNGNKKTLLNFTFKSVFVNFN